jgi:hypothetical protein
VLIEVAAAVAVAAVGLTITLGALTGNYKASVQARAFTQSLLRLEDEIQYISLRENGAALNVKDRCSAADPDLECRWMIDGAVVPGTAALHRADLAVIRDRGRQARRMDVSIFSGED